MAAKDFSADYLRSILAYDANTGVFTRLVRTANRVKVGDAAGCKRSDGYIVIRVLDRLCQAHRLAWLHFYGTMPTGCIDHIDGNPSNNAIENLRDVTVSVNNQNRRMAQSNSSHKTLGVSPNRKRWKAEICVGGERHRLGTYDTPELAHAAYLAAKRRLHPGGMI